MSRPRPTTVVFLSNAASREGPAHVAGTGPDPALLREGLAARGFVVRQRRLHGFPANPFARLGTFYAGFDPLRAACVLLLDRRADVVVSVGESNVVLILLLARLFRFKPPVVLREISARGWARRDRVVDYVVPRVHRILALTPHQTAWAPAHWRLKAPPDLVGFAIDETFFAPQDCPDGGYVLAVGDDVGRDYACLIAACRDTPYRLVLRTDTQPAIPAEMADRVTILGRLSYVALRDLYAAASVVAVPLRQIDHPSGITALFEGMAMGRPVIASDVGTARGVVEDGTNGVLVGVGDPEAMREAVTRLMRDVELRRRLGENARRAIEGELSYAAYVRRFAASLRATLAEAGGRGRSRHGLP